MHENDVPSDLDVRSATEPITIFADIPAGLTDDQRHHLLLAMRARLAEVYVGAEAEPMTVEVHDFEGVED